GGGRRPARAPPHAEQTAPCLDQWLRGTSAGHHPAGTLACGLPPTLLHEPRGLAAEPGRFPAFLQPRALASRLPSSRPDPSRPFLGRRLRLMRCTALGRSTCQHHFESGQSSMGRAFAICTVAPLPSLTRISKAPSLASYSSSSLHS